MSSYYFLVYFLVRIRFLGSFLEVLDLSNSYTPFPFLVCGFSGVVNLAVSYYERIEEPSSDIDLSLVLEIPR